MQDSTSLLELAREYGWLAVLLVVGILNAGRICDWLEGILGHVWPELAETMRCRRQERRARQEARMQRETTALQELLDVYQQELLDEKAERKAAQRQIFELMMSHESQMRELVAKYEEFNSNSVEVLRELSQSVCDQGRRLDRIESSLSAHWCDRSCSEGG